MNKKLYIFIITVILAAACIMGCDTETKGSKKKTPSTSSTTGTTVTTVNGDGSGDQVELSDFNISPSGTVNMTVDETKDFIISYSPENANVIDLTWDVSGDKDVISFDMSAQILVTKTFTVTAIKEGSVTVTVKKISDPSRSRAVTIVVSNNGGQQGGDPTDDTGDTSDDTGDNTDDKGDQTTDPVETVTVATLDVTVNVRDVTIDDIYLGDLSWGYGTYLKGSNECGYSKRISHSAITITKESDKKGTIHFRVANEDFVDEDFALFYFLSFKNQSNIVVCNLEEIFQDNQIFTNTTLHKITLDIHGKYADQGIDIGGT